MVRCVPDAAIPVPLLGTSLYPICGARMSRCCSILERVRSRSGGAELRQRGHGLWQATDPDPPEKIL